jgi:hypothetical protein
MRFSLGCRSRSDEEHESQVDSGKLSFAFDLEVIARVEEKCAKRSDLEVDRRAEATDVNCQRAAALLAGPDEIATPH